MAIAAVLTSLQGSVMECLYHLRVASLLVPILYVILNECIRNSTRVKGMTGPWGLPLIGNLAQIRTDAAEQYRLWSKKHSAVYQIQLRNIPVIVVRSATSAKVLFGHNAQALSSRPETDTFHKIVSNTARTTIGTSPYGESLKRRRKGAASALNLPSVDMYVSHLDVETKAYVEELYRYGNHGKTPINPMPMIQRLSLSLALTLNWGVRIASQEKELFDEITEVEEKISRFRSTTGNLQDYLPLLRLNPFSANLKRAVEMRTRRDKYLGALYSDLDDRMAKGIHKPCIQANVIMEKEAKLNSEELTSIRLTMPSGGLDTVTTLVAWSLGLLSQRPDIQDRAAVAVREMYGEDEPMCSSDDDRKCAYIAALVKECLRFFTVLRLALPRTSIEDITYDGIIISKDPDVWADPDEFRPERWLKQPDAPLFTYGMGYRMCAGSLLANCELYLVFIRTLNSFRLEPHDKTDYHPLRGNSDPTSLVAIPRKYQVRFVPKNEKALSQVLVQ
ncbi:hypothetical protein PDIDSM_2570 [Penicillium digitatum]|nr:hypothetical protein PDIDSM_2570 [Penicillium digitatum]